MQQQTWRVLLSREGDGVVKAEVEVEQVRRAEQLDV
jgi:hypothetical protein